MWNSQRFDQVFDCLVTIVYWIGKGPLFPVCRQEVVKFSIEAEERGIHN
jgi:hypothetical protein